MESRYSQLSEYELKQEIADLKVKAQKAEQLSMINEVAVHERKMMMAEAYLLNPDNYKPGEVYFLNGDPENAFEISYMNGIFAWGWRNGNGELEAFPISILKEK